MLFLENSRNTSITAMILITNILSTRICSRYHINRKQLPGNTARIEPHSGILMG